MAFAYRLAIGLCSCALGCNDLPRVPAFVCGNGVTEPPEECDTFAPEGQRCRAPGLGVEDACRFECSTEGDSTLKCPADSACGLDGICRFSTKRYEPWGDIVPVVAESLQLGDFDGDGRQDLLALGNTNPRGQSVPRIYFFDESGRALEPFDPQTPIRSPVVTQPTGDGSTEDRGQRIVFATDFGIATLEGTEDRSVLPIAYPYQVVPEDWLYRVLRVRGSSASVLGDGIVLMLSTKHPAQTTFRPAEPVGFPEPLAALPGALDRLAGEVQVGDVVEGPGSPCEELVLAERGDTSVRLLEPCDGAGEWRVSGALEAVVELPKGRTIGGEMLLTRVDADAHLDLLLTDEEGVPYLALGRGDGSFVADPADPGSTLGDAWPVVVTLGNCPGALTAALGFPLAMGDLNADGLPDWVVPVGVVLVTKVQIDAVSQQVGIEACPGNAPFVGEWSLASVADLNDDGRLDLVAASSSAPGLDFFAGTGLDRMNPFGISTEGPVSHMAVADFDGDLTQDLAVGLRAQQADATEDAELDKVAIAFGRRDGAPSLPVEVGQFSAIKQLSAANYQTEDAIAELGVIAESLDYDGEGLTVFVGNPGRHPIASLGLVHFAADGSVTSDASVDDTTTLQTPIACAVGRFSGTGSLGLVALGLEDGPSSTMPPRLWYAEGPTLTRLSKPSPSTELSDLRRAWQADAGETLPVLLAGDINGDQADEALLLAPGTEKDTLALWRVLLPSRGDGWPDRPLAAASTGTGRLVRASHPTLVDIDEDGWLDLVLIVADAKGVRQIGVVWNVKGALDLSQVVRIDAAVFGGRSVQGFAARSDGRAIRWAAVTDRASFLISTGPAAREALEANRIEDAPGGHAVTLGDLTGDGLMDLVVAEPGGLRFFAEVAKKP